MMLLFRTYRLLMKRLSSSQSCRTATPHGVETGSRKGSFLSVLLLAACVAACAPKKERVPQAQPAPQDAAAQSPAQPASPPAPPPATDLDEKRDQALMAAIFKDGVRQADGSTLAIVREDGEDSHYLMTLFSTKGLPDGRIVAVVNGMTADAQGLDTSGYGTGGSLNVYVLRPEGKGWSVLERHEHVADIGSRGTMGGIEWITVAPGKPGFLVSGGGTWQGITIDIVHVFDLENGVRALGNFMRQSDNAGDCIGEEKPCWDIDGSIRLVEGARPHGHHDILVDFTGKRTIRDSDEQDGETERLVGRVKETARYSFDGKKYELVAGANPAADAMRLQ